MYRYQYRVLKELNHDVKLGFDKFARLATLVCDTKISIVNFLDDKAQYSSMEVAPGPYLQHASVGKPLSICAHTILRRSAEIFEIPDTTQDWRFRGKVNTFVFILIVAICYGRTVRSILCWCPATYENRL
jgi:hypothetical protein